MWFPGQAPEPSGGQGSTDRCVHCRILRIALVTLAGAVLVLFPSLARPQNSSDSARESFVQEKASLESQIANTNQKGDQAQQVLQQSEMALAKAQYLDDSAAEAVARQAIAIANQAIGTDRRTLQVAEARLAAVNGALLSLDGKRKTMPPVAAELVETFNEASNQLNLPRDVIDIDDESQSLNCKRYFQTVGAQLLSGRGLPASPSSVWKDKSLDANGITQQIESNPIEWQEVNESDVQILANQGIVVVGVSSGVSHGHLAFAFPVPPALDLSQFKNGSGPFVRDGNVHPSDQELDRRLYPSGWGAVRATKAFAYGNQAPKWYIWMPSTEPVASSPLPPTSLVVPVSTEGRPLRGLARQASN